MARFDFSALNAAAARSPTPQRDASPAPNQDDDDAVALSEDLGAASLPSRASSEQPGEAGATAPVTPTPRPKRPRPVDLVACAESEARKYRLTEEGRNVVIEAAKRPVGEQNMLVLTLLMSVKEQLAAVAPKHAVFELPKKADKMILLRAYRTIVSPRLAAYVARGTPVQIIAQRLQSAPAEWDLPVDVATTPHKWAVVNARIHKICNSRRYDVKKVIAASIGTLDSATGERTGSRDIVDLAKSVAEINKTSKVTVSLEMLGRVALLRSCYVLHPGDDFWEFVDEYLADLRTNHPSALEQSQKIANLLRADQDTYGRVTIEGVPAVSDDAPIDVNAE